MKKLKIFLLVFISIFVFNYNKDNVKAYNQSDCPASYYACAVCNYSGGGTTVSILVKSDGKNVSINKTGSNTEPGSIVNYNLSATTFKSGDLLVCPTNLYVSTSPDPMVSTFTVSASSSAGTSMSLTGSYNNDRTVSGNAIPVTQSQSSVTCNLTNANSITISDAGISINKQPNYEIQLGSGLTKDYFKTSDGGYQCKTVYTACYNTSNASICTVTTTRPQAVNPNVGDVTYTIDETSPTGTSTSDPFDPTPDVEGCEVLGSTFYGFVKSAFVWIQIGAPIIALILSMVDFAQAILSGEDDAKKKATKNVKTRLIAAFSLVLIPFILDMILHLVDDFNGTTCGL